MKRKNILYLLFVVSIMAIWSCEKIKEDELSQPIPTTPSGTTGKEIYTFQNSDVAMDPSQFISILDVKSYKLVGTPKYGKATILSDGILQYSPYENVVEAEEQLTLELERNNSKSVIQEISILIVPNQAQLPCLFAAMGDRVKTEVNREVVIDVIENDQICEGVIKEVTLLSKPINGTATIVNKKIKYSSKQGFKGVEKFLYLLLIENNGQLIRRPGVVIVDVVDSSTSGTLCKTALKNDLIEIFLTKDSILINVLSNDKFCMDDLQKGKLSVLKQTVNGRVDFLNNKLLSYKPKFIPAGFPPLTDSLTYKFVNTAGESFSAKVLILPKKINPNCQIQAFGDEFEFSIKALAGKTFVELDVLKNDFTCGKIITKIEVIPYRPEFSVLNNKIRYTPTTEFKKGVMAFQYEITADLGEKSKSGTVKIKFVD